MKPAKRRVSGNQLTAILLVAIVAFLLMPENVTASPSQTLVVENNTDATITVTATRAYSGEVKVAEIAPQSDTTLNDFLPTGVVDVSFDPKCVEPRLHDVRNTYRHNDSPKALASNTVG